MRTSFAAIVALIFMVGLDAWPAPSYGKSDDAGHDLFVSRVVPRLQIEIPKEGMAVLRQYRQVWRQPRPERVDVRATIREGRTVYTNVALHLKGSFTFQPIDAKPSLTLNFDKFAPGQRFHGLTKIHLNSSVQDPSYLCEALARELFNDAGVPAPRAGHALVNLNGRQLGLFVLIEGVNRQFLKRHFKSTTGNLYEAALGGDITNRLEVTSGANPNDRSHLTNLVNAANQTDPAKRFVELKTYLDTERFFSFVALEVLLVHWDGYSTGGPNNYRIFHDTSRDKIVFMPQGLDQIFVGIPPANTITPHFTGLVARKLMTTPEGRRAYLDRVASFATNEFRDEALFTRVEKIASRLRPALANEREIMAEMDEGARFLTNRIGRRTQIVAQCLKHPERPLEFGADNTARLSDWRFKTSNTQPARGSRAALDKREVLQVASRGPGNSGSWRTVVLLEEGRYEFTGQAHCEGLSRADANGTNGVNLRVSGERVPNGVIVGEWTTLRYEFAVVGIENVELVAEFRGSRGSGSFDPTSFRLIRKER